MNVLADTLLRRGWEPVEPMDFYRAIFPAGELEEAGVYEQGRYCGIAVEIEHKKGKQGKIRRYSITDDLDTIDALLWSKNFVVVAPISYIGKSRVSQNARKMYAFAVELDGLDVDKQGRQVGLDALIAQWSDRIAWLPRPTYVVCSGNGLHLYYLLDAPLNLWPQTVKTLARYKKRLTYMLWNGHVTRLTGDKIQYESVFQAFRLVGGVTKAGDRVQAFRVPDGGPVSIDYLNSFVRKIDAYKDDVIDAGTVYANPSGLSRAEAAKKWPEWYERRVVQGAPRGHWTTNRAVYDWWLQRIRTEARVGHRYYCIMMLAIYAIKCDIPRDVLERDALSLLDDYDAMTDRADNHFELRDVQAALQVYDDAGYVTYPIHAISARSGLHIARNKRNGRRQDQHLRIARLSLQMRNEDAGHALQGRHDKAQQVADWRAAHPDGRKVDCHRDTGLSRSTIDRWWAK